MALRARGCVRMNRVRVGLDDLPALGIDQSPVAMQDGDGDFVVAGRAVTFLSAHRLMGFKSRRAVAALEREPPPRCLEGNRGSCLSLGNRDHREAGGTAHRRTALRIVRGKRASANVANESDHARMNRTYGIAQLERARGRHEGTKARRHEGTKAQRHKGTKGRKGILEEVQGNITKIPFLPSVPSCLRAFVPFCPHSLAPSSCPASRPRE